MVDVISLMSRSDKKMARITNSNDLVELYENVHHLLWTREGFSPEKAMDHLNLFLYLMCIEPQIDAGNIALPECCRFSYLAKIEDENILFDVIKKKVQLEINKNPITKDYFTRIEIQYPETVFNLIKHLNRIDLTIDDKDFLGGIYEYIIGRGMTTMSDDGQYFTERQICRYAMALSDIKPGVVHTMIDPFCGTGGFITEYVKAVQNGVEDKVAFWKENGHHIFGNDIKVSSVMSTLLNLIFVTGVSFSKDNVIHKNSLYDSLFNGKKFKYIFTNPPFGGDKSKGDDFKFKYGDYIKGKPKKPENYVYKVSEEIQTIGIQIDDKVAAAVQLCMAMLDEGGTCGIVLPEGFFFQTGKQLVELRKKLVEDFNVKYIVDIPQGVFENTSTKTCLMIFSKEGKTSEVEFIDFMKRNEEKRTLISASIDELKVKDYSFNFKKYLKQVWNLDDGYVLKKLGDIVEFVNGKTHKTSEASIHGKYPLFSSSLELAYFMDSFDYNRQCLIVNTINAVGNCNIHISECFSRTSNTMAFTSNTDKVLNKYLYYVLKGNLQLLKNCFTGTTKKKFNKSDLVEIEIPVPSISRQREIVEEIDNYAVRASKMKELVKDMEKGLMFAVRRMVKNPTDTVTIRDVAVVKYGSSKIPTDLGKHPLVGGGEKHVRLVSQYNVDEDTILVGRSGNPGRLWITDTKSFVASYAFYLKLDTAKVTAPYLYFLLKNKEEEIRKLGNGTCQRNLNRDIFYDMIIPLVPLTTQQSIQAEYVALKQMKYLISLWEDETSLLISKLG
jgi:type I restriction-modification system DNA methylase subunit